MPNLESLPRFGICPRCGRTGLDDDTGDALTGYELIEFRGEYMCSLCKIEIEDREHDQLANEKHNDEDAFRHAIGMKFTVQ